MWPERRHFDTPAFIPASDVERLVRMSLPVAEYRQVSSQADCIKVLEKIVTIPTQQILQVVFRSDQEEVNPGFIEQGIELGG